MFRLLLCIAVFFLPQNVVAQDFTHQESGKVVAYKNGQPMHVYDKDEEEILSRMIEVFNNNKHSSAGSSVFKNSITRSGFSVEEMWNHLRTGSYFSARLNAPTENEEGDVILDELMVTMITNPNASLIGAVMARHKNGKIRAYDVDNIDLINLYCLDKAAKYLPAHYQSLSRNYSNPEYADSGISCSTQDNQE